MRLVAERVARMEPQLRESRAELRDLIVQANEEGVSVRLIASTAGISRQRVNQILADSEGR